MRPRAVWRQPLVAAALASYSPASPTESVLPTLFCLNWREAVVAAYMHEASSTTRHYPTNNTSSAITSPPYSTIAPLTSPFAFCTCLCRKNAGRKCSLWCRRTLALLVALTVIRCTLMHLKCSFVVQCCLLLDRGKRAKAACCSKVCYDKRVFKPKYTLGPCF